MIEIKNPAYNIRLDIESMELQLLDKRVNEGKIGFLEPYYDLFELESMRIITPGGLSLLLSEPNLNNGFDLSLFEKQNCAEAILLFVDGKSEHLVVDCDGLAELIRVLHKRFTLDSQVPQSYNSKMYRPLSEGRIRHAKNVAERNYIEKRNRALSSLKSALNGFITPLTLVFVFFGFVIGSAFRDLSDYIGRSTLFAALLMLVVMHIIAYFMSVDTRRRIAEELKGGAGKPEDISMSEKPV